MSVLHSVPFVQSYSNSWTPNRLAEREKNAMLTLTDSRNDSSTDRTQVTVVDLRDLYEVESASDEEYSDTEPTNPKPNTPKKTAIKRVKPNTGNTRNNRNTVYDDTPGEWSTLQCKQDWGYANPNKKSRPNPNLVG